MDNLTNKIEVTADTAGAEENGAVAELGKFKDVKALLDAYTNLEAEFTRRSQRLKELEKATSVQPAPEKSASATDDSQMGENSTGKGLLEQALGDEKVKKAIIEDFLKSVSANKTVPLLSGGMQIPAPNRTPKTVKEAGRLAQEFLK